MGTQEKMEREISIMDLFWDILFHWREIICFGVLAAVLIGGMKYVHDMKVYRAMQNVEVEQEKQLTAEEQEQLEDARLLMERIENYENYLNESALMQIDPYNKPIIELQYYVESNYTYNYTQDNRRDYTDNLMSLYCNYIKSGEMSNKLIEATKISISQADFSELCTVTQNGGTMAITFTWAEEEKLEEISEFIKTQLIQKEKEFQKVGSHELNLLRESQNTIADTVLAETKNTYANNISYINTQLTTLKNNMSEEQLILLDGKEKIEGAGDKDKIIKPGISKRYLLLGAVLGVFLVCAWVVCRMFFTARLQRAEEIRTLYNIRLLGEITLQCQRKRFLSAIDEKLLAIRNRRKKKMSVEQQIKVIATNIALSCKQQEIGQIYMTGSEYDNMDMGILDMLKRELAAQNIQVSEGGNIFYDASSLKQGTEIGNILFIEQTGKSIYDEISNELNLVKEQKNQMLGVVVLVS